MRWLFVVAVVATMPVLAYGSSEDEPDDDSEQPATVELAFTVVNARLKAKFAFEVEGPGVAQNVRSYPIPPSSVVTSAVAIVEGKRHPLRLEKADVADRAFDALTLKPGRNGHRAWAFVLDSSTAAITVDVLAPRTANLLLELTLDAPTCFYNDVRYVELPRSWWQRVPAAQKKISASNNDIGQACGGA